MGFLAAIGTAIGGAITGFGSFIGGLGVVGKAVVGIGLNLAANALVGSIARGRAQRPPPSGVELDVQYGGDRPRIVRCGRFGVAGHLIYANSSGPANRDLQQVFVLSDFRTTNLDKVWIDGEPVTLGAFDAIKGHVVDSGEYAGLIWIRHYDGRQLDADPGLVAAANPAGRWTADHRLSGISYIVVTMQFDQERLGNVPQFFFEGKGAPLYDFRKDSTVGGSGPHRWDDPATWEFSENPVLMDYAYRRGFTVNGDLFCGMDMAESDLPVSRWALAANICDEHFNGETRYRCAVGFDAGPDAEHGDNIDAVMKACGGMVVHGVDGAWPLIGTDQITVATLTDDDLIVGQPVRFQARRPSNELVNSVSGTFPNPDNQWSPTGYERATDAATVAIDRRSKDVAIDFETVPYAKQAAQLAAIYFSENRFEANATITARPRWQVLEPGDWIVWQSARYGTRSYMVTDMALASLHSDGPRNVALSLQERAGAIYDSVGVVTPPLVAPPNAEPVRQQELLDFIVVPTQMVGDRGQVAAAIRASWSAPLDPDITGAVIEYRIKAGLGEIMSQAVPRERTVARLTDGVVSATAYQVRHRLVTDPPRPVSPSAWVDVITPDAPLTDVRVALSSLDPTVRAWIDEQLSARFETHAQWIAELGAAVAERALEDVVHRREVTREVGRETGAVRARLVDEQALRAREDEALASRISITEASTGTNAAAITENRLAQVAGDDALAQSVGVVQVEVDAVQASVVSADQARIAGDDALGQSLASVQASVTGLEGEVAGISASGLIAISANASPTGGAQSQVDIATRAVAGGPVSQAAMSLRAQAGGVSEALFQADRMIFTDGINETPAILFHNGAAYLAVANIGLVTAGFIQSPNGRFTADLNTGELVWYN